MSDHTAGYAAYTLVPDDVRILTIEFKINFLKPAYGNALKCKSEAINQGKNIIVAQSSVFDVRDTDEKMVSKSTITLRAIRAGCENPSMIFTFVAAADASPRFWGNITLWAMINALAEREPPLVRIEDPMDRLP